MLKILLTGKNGQVGWELERSLQPLGQVFAFDRAGMDLADPDSIRRTIRDVKPDLIINAAAYTAVDRAESEPDLAMAINGMAPGIMAEEAKRLDAALIHYSTDYVFDGTKPSSYEEHDLVNPLGEYGASKLAGERAIQNTWGRHLIFRTSWIYGMRGNNFPLTILKSARQHEELQVVADQFGAPTWSRMVASATSQIAARLLSERAKGEVVGGTYHITCAGEVSRFEFAQFLIKRVFMEPSSDRNVSEARPPRVVPITTEESGLSARRPKNSRLSCKKLYRNFGIALPHWSLVMDLYLDEIMFSERYGQ